MNRDIKVLIILSGFGALPWGYISIVEPLYFSTVGLSPTEIGLLFTAMGLVGSILTIPFGILADNLGRRPLLILSGFFTFAAYFIYISTTSFILFLIASVIFGLTNAMFFPAWMAIFADKTTIENREKAFSYSSFANSVGTTIGSLIAALPDILEDMLNVSIIDGYRLLFFFGGVIYLSISLVFIWIKEERIKHAKKRIMPVKSRRVITKFVVTGALIGFGAGFIIPLFSLWFYLKFHVGGSFLGPLYASASVVMALAYLIAPKLAEIIGTINTIVYTQALATLLLVLIPLTSNIYIVALLYVSRNFLMNMSNPIQTAFMMTIVDPDERGSASSITSAAWSIPNSISPTFGGYIMQNLSLSLPFYLCGFHYTISIILFYVFFRKYKNIRKEKVNQAIAS